MVRHAGERNDESSLRRDKARDVKIKGKLSLVCCSTLEIMKFGEGIQNTLSEVCIIHFLLVRQSMNQAVSIIIEERNEHGSRPPERPGKMEPTSPPNPGRRIFMVHHP
jgi:hypothetical protein